MSKETLGVLGGLGPMATAHFLELVTEMTEAAADQDHLDMILFSTPSIPDRTAHILGQSSLSPLPGMLAAGRRLAALGVSRIAIPCMTAHFYCRELEEGISVPLVNGVRETVNHLKEHGISSAGILATTGTLRSQIFHRELERSGIRALIPGEKHQDHVMHLIFENIKAGKPPEMDRFSEVTHQLRRQGAEGIILGCTELSLIKRAHPLGPGFLDAMEVLACQSIRQCGLNIKPQYETLITP